MQIVTRIFAAGLLAFVLALAIPKDLQAQYPVIVQPVAPSVADSLLKQDNDTVGQMAQS
jgi:hypothetical protein